MSTTRAIAILLGTLALAGCHKKAQDAAADAATGAADNSDSGSSTDSASSDDGAADSAAADSGATGDAGGDAGAGADAGAAAPEGGAATTVATTGAGYGGTYSCFGTLKLTQTNNTVSGNAESRTGNTTQSTDFSCQVAGDRCSGNTNSFLSVNGMQPKPKGKGKVTFRLVSGGLEYTQVQGGASQQGFCKRN